MIDIQDYIKSIDRSLLIKLGVILIAFIVFVVFFLVPAFKDHGDLVSKKKENKAATQKALINAAEYARLSEDHLKAESELKEVSQLIATDKQVKNVLSEISELATSCNVKILEMLPQDKNLGEDPLLDEYCERHGLQIDLECGYHQLANFIQKLETHKYIIQIISLRMIPGEQGKTQLARLDIAVISKKKDFLT